MKPVVYHGASYNKSLKTQKHSYDDHTEYEHFFELYNFITPGENIEAIGNLAIYFESNQTVTIDMQAFLYEPNNDLYTRAGNFESFTIKSGKTRLDFPMSISNMFERRNFNRDRYDLRIYIIFKNEHNAPPENLELIVDELWAELYGTDILDHNPSPPPS